MHLPSPEHTDVFIVLSVLQNRRDCCTSSSIFPSLHSSLNKQASKPWWQPAHGDSCKARRSLSLGLSLGPLVCVFLVKCGDRGPPTSLRARQSRQPTGPGGAGRCPRCWAELSRVLSGALCRALRCPWALAATRGSALGAQELGTAQGWRWWHKVRGT